MIDRDTAAVGDPFTVTITVTNAGPATAQGRESYRFATGLDRAAGDGTLRTFAVAPGASHTFALAGTINAQGYERGRARVGIAVAATGETVDEDNFAEVSVAVPGRTNRFEVHAGLALLLAGSAAVAATMRRRRTPGRPA